MQVNVLRAPAISYLDGPTAARIHYEAEKEPVLCASVLNTWHKLVNLFTYIEEIISYNSVYLILACVKNFAVTVTLKHFMFPMSSNEIDDYRLMVYSFNFVITQNS